MARRVVSVLRGAARSLRATEPALEANAYAVAEDLEVSVVLTGQAVELALAAAAVRPSDIAGVALPPAASGQDLRGLIESGVRVYAGAEDLQARGMDDAALVEGVETLDEGRLAALLRDADGVVTW
jgi:predicted peroxiredoxin